ncbi:MAG: M48 family metalloprotease, partial [Candidatus Sulfotelmatobacter sp.]
RKVDVPASPAAVLYLVADTEQELTRMPANFTRMSDEEEIRIGDELAKMYGFSPENKNRAEVRIVDLYLKQVGGLLAAHAHRKLPYRFHYVPNENMINAFALPGGHVYVGAGLLALMDSEDELAAVLGHEIEHIDHHHCAERAQQEEALRRIPLGGLVAIPIFVFEAGYTKDQELEADREGTKLAVEAGYSVNGAIRMFEAFNRMYERYRAQKAHSNSPQEELSDVAMQTLEGYFRSHPLPAERIAQIQKLIASEGWSAKSERDLAVAYIFWTDRAQTAMNEKKYSEAEQLASRSLKMHPDQPEARYTLARAQFSQVKFSDAAASYRSLLEKDSNRLPAVEAYAMALAAANRQNAANEFRGWLESVRGEEPRNAQVEQVGLSLLAGDSTRAHKYEEELRLSDDTHAPDYLGTLGWWYYMAGDNGRAAHIFDEVVQQRPADVNLWMHRAWVEIEIKRFSDAIQTVNNGVWKSTGLYEEHPEGERAMARAVAFWQANEADSAMGDFDRAVAGQPEWLNSQWVKALYSPLVAQSVEQMKAERERRKKERMAEKR